MSAPFIGRLPRALATALAGLAAIITVLAGGNLAYAGDDSDPPASSQDITNVDVLRQQIRDYYGDPTGTGVASRRSDYAHEVRSIAAAGERWLAAPHRTHGTPAIVLDVDDTTLLTWNYQIFSTWAYNPATNAVFVKEQLFPAVFAMRRLVRAAAREGYAIIWVTGRPASQEEATLGNLTEDGVGVDAHYPEPTTLRDGEDGLFTRPEAADYPDYLQEACADDPNGVCTTSHYKAATRAHIESLGYDIVANFGDQLSDFAGGHADKDFKLPNPNYLIP